MPAGWLAGWPAGPLARWLAGLRLLAGQPACIKLINCSFLLFLLPPRCPVDGASHDPGTRKN